MLQTSEVKKGEKNLHGLRPRAKIRVSEEYFASAFSVEEQHEQGKRV
jgi:hypothetical protein